MNHGVPQWIMEDILKVCKENLLVKRILLFGSRARGSFRYNSDIDLYLEGEGISYYFPAKIKEKSGVYKVQVVIPEYLDNPELLESIARDGIVLFNRAET